LDEVHNVKKGWIGRKAFSLESNDTIFYEPLWQFLTKKSK